MSAFGEFGKYGQYKEQLSPMPLPTYNHWPPFEVFLSTARIYTGMYGTICAMCILVFFLIAWY